MKKFILLLVLIGLFMRKSPSAYNIPDRAELISSNGYASELNNGGGFRYNAITSVNLSGTIYQALCYWNSNGNLAIEYRELDSSWSTFTSTITLTDNDGHDVVAIGIDPNGYVHVAYDMHNEALNYRVSSTTIDNGISGLGALSSMVGTNESSVTYPTFINDPSGKLYFIFRDGGSGNGDLIMYEYNESTTTWSAVAGTTAGKVISGKPVPTSPYFDHPAFDADFGSGGYFHLSWHWRDLADGASVYHDKCYVKWDGTNWYQADGTSQTMPITQANAEVVDDTTTTDIGMSAFASLVVDSSGNPHIIYPKTGGDGYKHLWQAYYNSGWTISQITTTLVPAISDSNSPRNLRPSAALEQSTGILYVLYVDDVAGSGLWVAKSSDFSNWTYKQVYPFNSGSWKPKYDWVEFERTGNLYIPIEAYYGANDGGNNDTMPIYLWKVDPSIW